jgi:iron complex transport system ATP-binding protein
MSALRLEGLACGYGGRAVVRVDDFALEPGEARVIVGPNGSGKSTILRTIAGATPPMGGRVEVAGEDVARLPAVRRARLVTMLMQIQPLDPGLTVVELARLGRTPHLGRWGRLTPADLEAVDRAIDECRLGGMRDRRLGEMSGGERQRARLAMVLAQETPLILLDEPTNHLDVEHRYMLFGIVEQARSRRGCAVLMVSHSLEDARRFADSAILVNGGRTRFFGPREHELLLEAFRAECRVPPEWVY